MLTIIMPRVEGFDDTTQEFVTALEEVVLDLEHSLVALSKWESIHEKPFLTATEKSAEETLDYIKAMCVTPNVPDEVWNRLTKEHLDQINGYIDSKMTATWFSDTPNAPKSREVITSELIYYWLDSLDINWEAQHWHLSRLFTLIKVHSAKSQKPKKMSRSEMAARNRQLNEQRRAQLGTRG